MVAEAQQRHAHNRQRRRLKQLLGAASEDGSTVATKDLLLAAKLAKMDLPEEMVADTPYALGLDGVGMQPCTYPLPSACMHLCARVRVLNGHGRGRRRFGFAPTR